MNSIDADYRTKVESFRVRLFTLAYIARQEKARMEENWQKTGLKGDSDTYYHAMGAADCFRKVCETFGEAFPEFTDPIPFDDELMEEYKAHVEKY